ncbi:RagB/SusD family nutrient uptake outer membrane protein, partial [Segatella buccae]
YYLLQAHGGYDEQGNLLGVPIVTEPENSASNFNVPRNTFADCMKAIYDDCAKALELLPAKYTDITSEAQIPEACKSLGADVSRYNRVFGVKFNGRMDGSIVEAFRSKAALLAASPAYS